MSIPQSLAVNLKRFQNAVVSTQRISGDRASYGSASTATFSMPRSGCLDLQSIALLGTLGLTTTGAPTSVTTQPLHSLMVRRVEFVVGGNVVSLNQLSDYGLAFYMSRIYASNKGRTDYQQNIGLEGNIAVSITANAGSTPLVIASEWLGFMSGKHCRFLPLDILPEVQIVVYFHDVSRWYSVVTGGTSPTVSASLTDMRLLYNRFDFQDNMLARLWADRITKAPITIPFENVSYFEGAATTATAGSFSAYVNSQSIDYIAVSSRPGTYDSDITKRYTLNDFNLGASTDAAKNNTLVQVTFNGAPLSSFQLTPMDAVWQTQASLGGAGNMLYAPDFGTVTGTFAEFRDNYFALFHRMKLDTNPEDGEGWVTGTPTYGQSMEVAVNFTADSTATTSKKPIIVVWSTGTLEIGAGKQIAVAN